MSKYSEKFIYCFIHEGKNYGIIVDFFSAISESKTFLKVLDNMSKGMGYNLEVSGCCFPSGCDEEDIENGEYFQDGVMFFLNDAEVIVDYQTFYNCLKLACNIYLECFPEDEEEIKERLEFIKELYYVE